MGVTFNEENAVSRTSRPGSNSGIVTKLFMKMGLASEGQARIVMIVISLASIAATIFVLMYS